MKQPICVKCGLVMKAKKTGADVEQTSIGGLPYQIWMADIFKCVSCGIEVASGFGSKPVAEHYDHERYAKFEPGVTLRFRDYTEEDIKREVA